MKLAARDCLGCDAEVLVRSSTVQAFSKIIVFCPHKMEIVAKSDNACFDISDGLFGIFDEATVGIFNQTLSDGDTPTNQVLRLKDGKDYWSNFFWSDEFLCCELMQDVTVSADYRETTASYSGAVRRLAKRAELASKGAQDVVSDYLEAATREMQRLTRFDRVLAYKFDSDWNGEVIAESSSEYVPHSFYGLRFPSKDIPASARALFQRNRVRLIADVSAEEVSVTTTTSEAEPFNFHSVKCFARHASQVHRTYLNNMNVTATMVIAIMVSGRLWGLITCHHYSGPKVVSPVVQTLAASLADAVSAQITSLQSKLLNDVRRKVELKLRHDLPERNLFSDKNKKLDFNELLGELGTPFLSELGASLLVFVAKKQIYAIGDSTGSACIGDLLDITSKWMDGSSRSEFSSCEFRKFFPDAKVLPQGVSGVAHFRTPDASYELLVLRPPANALETWAGDPNKEAEYCYERKGFKLDPRSSFEAYYEVTADRSEEWTEPDLEKCRTLLFELVSALSMFQQSALDRMLKQRLEDEKFYANRDPLTGLLNRRAFTKAIAAEEKLRSQNNASKSWLLLLDLNKFKFLNDRYGHDVGDYALVYVAKILTKIVGKENSVARLGGDEFALLISGRVGPTRIMKLCEKILSAVEQPFEAQGCTHRVSCSIGVVKTGSGTEYEMSDLKLADLGLYEAKKEKAGAYRICTPALVKAERENVAIAHDISQALQNGEFIPYYQPIVCSKTFVPTSFEVLARWQHPEKGILLPGHFIDVAQAAGVLEEIDHHIFLQATRQQTLWAERIGYFPKIALNISPQRLANAGNWIYGIQNREQRAKICFELLETIYFEGQENRFSEDIQRIKSAGLNVALDDFGSGHSSLLAIISLRPNVIKIDRRIVQPIETSDAAMNFLSSIVTIAKELKIQTTAEGIETEIQRDRAIQCGCDFLQGFYFGRPRSAADVLGCLQEEQNA